MSLRRRLLIIVFLAAAVTTAAVAAMLQLVESGDSGRIEAAEANGDAAADAIAASLAQRPEGASGTLAAPSEALRRFLFSTAAEALAAVPRATGGWCTRDGTLIVQARSSPRRHDRRAITLPPDQRAAVEDACRKAPPGTETHHVRVHTRTEVLVVSVTPVEDGGAWTVVPVRVRDAGPAPWKIAAGIIAVGTLLLVLATIDAIIALRRGARELDDGLHALQSDLRAKIVRPRAEELATIAKGLEEMAIHLDDARGRERALAATLAHEQRLSALGRVTAGVAHEIRNPLAGMKLRLDMMARDAALPTEMREDVRVCLDEVARLDRVVQSLLGVARRGPGERVDVALAPLVDERLRFGEEMASQRHVSLRRHGGAAITLATDRDALARILDNLVRNAIEASADASEVAVVIEPAPERVAITVEDAGAGIDAKHAAELFEPFFTTKPEGTGLGLWLTRSLVTALGGTIEHSRVADRTRFTVVLPLRPA